MMPPRDSSAQNSTVVVVEFSACRVLTVNKLYMSPLGCPPAGGSLSQGRRKPSGARRYATGHTRRSSPRYETFIGSSVIELARMRHQTRKRSSTVVSICLLRSVWAVGEGRLFGAL